MILCFFFPTSEIPLSQLLAPVPERFCVFCFDNVSVKYAILLIYGNQTNLQYAIRNISWLVNDGGGGLTLYICCVYFESTQFQRCIETITTWLLCFREAWTSGVPPHKTTIERTLYNTKNAKNDKSQKENSKVA